MKPRIPWLIESLVYLLGGDLVEARYVGPTR